MLRRNDISILIRPDQSWPLWFSLLLHAALLYACCAIPHAPKVRDCIMVDLEMPRLASMLPARGKPAPGPKGAPAPAPVKRTAIPALAAPPLARQTHREQTPQKIQAAPVVNAAPKAAAPVASRADTGAASKGQAAAASSPSSGTAHGGGSASGAGKGASGGSGGETGSGGSGGPGRPVDGVFGAQGGPAYLHKAMPVYPRFAQRIGKEGTVLLRLTLDESGGLTSVEIIEKAGHGFDESAMAAVKASRFRPAMRNGKPIPCRVLLPVRFELRD